MPRDWARGNRVCCISCTPFPAKTKGRRILSSMEKVSSRLNSWNTKPRLSRRKAARSRSGMVSRLLPDKSTSPAVGLSRAARIFSRVVLPEPDSPMMATYSPSCTEKDTPFRAWTRLPPNRVVYVFLTSLTCKISISYLRSSFLQAYFTALFSPAPLHRVTAL